MSKVSMQQICEDAGYECRSYSGRGMFGAKCLGVEIVNMGRFVADIIGTLEGYIGNDEEGEVEFYTAQKAFRRMKVDSMGLNSIAYFEDCPFVEHEDSDEDDLVTTDGEIAR